MPRITPVAGHPNQERSRPRDRTRGQAVTELALLLPLIFLLLIAAIDLGRLFQSQVALSSMAREGAMEAARDPDSFQTGLPCDSTTNWIMCRVLLEKGLAGENSDPFRGAVTVGVDDVAVSCDPVDCTEALGTFVTVTVQGEFSLITPILAPFTGGQDILLSSTATGPDRGAPGHRRADPDPDARRPRPRRRPNPRRRRRLPDPGSARDAHPGPNPDAHPGAHPDLRSAARQLHHEPVIGQEEEDRSSTSPTTRPRIPGARSPGRGTSGMAAAIRPRRSRTRSTSSTRRGSSRSPSSSPTAGRPIRTPVP